MSPSEPPHRNNPLFNLLSPFPPPQIIETPCKDASINLALQAIQKDPSLSIRSAAKIYKISRATLGRRLNGITPRRDSPPNSAKLTELEEKVIIERIIDLDSRSCSPWISGVGVMANLLLAARGALLVGTRWPYRFIARHEKLKTRQVRRYDYKRALCEDPAIINA